MTAQPSTRRHWQLLLSLALFFPAQAAVSGKPREHLYNEEDTPIIEYRVEHTEKLQMPDFVQDSYKGDRVVEFYSPTCPHCIHFKPNYVASARNFQNLTQQDTIYKGMNVEFYAVSCMKYTKVCRKQDVTAYPTLKIYSGTTGHVEKIHGSQLHPLTIARALDPDRANNKDQGEEDEEKEEEEVPEPIGSKSNAAAPNFLPRTQKEAYNDAYLTFYNALRDSVFLEDGPLPHTRGQAMRQWLHLLEKVLPPWRVGWIVKELESDFKNNAAVEKQWNSAVEMYPPKQKNYSPACQLHESPYTCGLWTLFHIVTVAVVEYNEQVIHTENKKAWQTKIQDIGNAAVMIREYVKNFFLCEECSTHFVKAFDDCEYRRCNRLTHKQFEYDEWRELPLWLLEFHNGVNIRLQKERFEREGRTEPPTKEEEQSVMWPPVSECPYCWIHLNGAKSEYTPEMVYQYLRMVYWPEDGTTEHTRRQLEADIARHEKNENSPHDYPAFSNGMPMGVDMNGDTPYMVVTALVCGVWLVVLFKKCRMDAQLGIHRNKLK